MSTVNCPVCGLAMDSDEYDKHLSYEHPDFQRDWFPPKEQLERDDKKEDDAS